MPDAARRQLERVAAGGGPVDRLAMLREAERRGLGPAVLLLACCGDEAALALHPMEHTGAEIAGSEDVVFLVLVRFLGEAEALRYRDEGGRIVAAVRLALAIFSQLAKERDKEHRKFCRRCHEGGACMHSVLLDQVAMAGASYLDAPGTEAAKTLRMVCDQAALQFTMQRWVDAPGRATCNAGDVFPLWLPDLSFMRRMLSGGRSTIDRDITQVRAAMLRCCVERANDLLRR